MNVIWDEKRCGYWFKSNGFDFFAYFTTIDPTNDDTPQFLECDPVQRKGDGFVLHLQIPIKRVANQSNTGIIETQVFNELRRFWAIS